MNRLLFLLFSLSLILSAEEIVMDEISSDDEIVLDEVASDEEIELEQAPIEKMPVQKKFVEATYPESIYSQGIEGTVTLELLVNETGTIDSVRCVKGLHPELDSNAVTAAKGFEFTPAIAGGNPVPVFIQYEYRYSLAEVVKTLEKFVNFSGTLVERGTRKPITNAMVVALFEAGPYKGMNVPLDTYLDRIGDFEGQEREGKAIVTTTDEAGRFHFTSLPQGQIIIKCPVTGYETFETRELIKENEEVTANLLLRKLSYDDYEVTAYYKGEEKEVSRRQLSISEIKKIPGLGGDAVKVVQALPGVARPSFSSGEVVVRGSYTWDSGFYLDGLSIPSIYHFGGLKSTFNSEGLDNVEFFPGGWGTTYGGAIGGLVNLRSRAPKTDRIHGLIDVSFLDASFYFEGPIVKDKLSFAATARRSYFGEIMEAVMKKSRRDFGMVISPSYWDYNVKLHYTPNDDHTISFKNFSSRDSMALVVDDLSVGAEEISEATNAISHMQIFNQSSIKWNWKITDKLENDLNYGLNYYHSDQSIFGEMSWTDSSFTHQFRDQLGFKANDKLRIVGGIDGYFENYNLDLNILTDEKVENTKDTDWKFGRFGVYTNFELTPNERLLLIPGIRYDYYKELKHDGSIFPEFTDYDTDKNSGVSGDPSLRVAARYKLNDKHTLKGSVGNYNQTPQPAGQVIHEKWGEPLTPTTKAAHYVLGHEWQITDLLSLDVQGYYNDQWDIPREQQEEDIDSTNPANTKIWYADGEGRTYGMEVMFRHNQSDRFFGWLAYSLSRSERRDPHNPKFRVFDKDQTHNLQLVGSWKLPKNWEVGGRLRYTTGNPETPVIGVEYEIDEDEAEPIYGKKNSGRMSPFFQLDVRAEKQFVLKNSILSYYIDIQNAGIFLHKNKEQEMYDDFYKEKKYIYAPIIPSIGFSWKF